MSYRDEFPGFDPATLPAIPAGYADISWGAEACPAFLNEAERLCLFVDFADPADREFPDCPRFSVQLWDDGATGWTPLATDDWDEMAQAMADPAALRLAAKFAMRLREEVGGEAFETVCARNATPAYDGGACASHDVCDANMVMDAAFTAATGRAFYPDDEEGGPTAADTALWNRAWAIAKAHMLTRRAAQE